MSIISAYPQDKHEFKKSIYSSEIDCDNPFTYYGKNYNVESLLESAEREVDIEKYRTIIRNGNISALEKPYLNDLQLGVLTIKELKLFRNMFYAIKGFIFSDDELTKYFNQFSWYSPKTKKIVFSNLETIAIEKIKIFESSSTVKCDFIDKDTIWEQFNGGADQRGFILKLFNDTKFEYIPSETINRIVKINGTWTISANKLVLTIETENVLFGGFIADHPNTPYIDKATSVTIKYEKPLKVLLPLNESKWNLNSSEKWLKIGSNDCYLSKK